jgi:2-methylisocitrate lyase-like PEP mutase family enzyme
MTTQIEKAKAFAALHKKGDPLVLYNIWDAASAIAVAKSGAKAVATGSASVAEAQGYLDAESIPIDFALRIAERIAASVEVPFTLDFEGGYTEDLDTLEANVTRVIAAGAVGINFEDQVIGASGLHDIDFQAERISAIRRAADRAGVPLWINARTDYFIQESDEEKHKGLMDAALEREEAYRKAGADSFFVPMLKDNDLIKRMCETCDLPVNVYKAPGVASNRELADLGAARISYGPTAHRILMAELAEHFSALS